ncbi:MAG: 30S ribosomal protein S4e, partial [Haloarculaceae archaeon]
MSNHQKRLSAPKRWPIERKTETFTVKADAGPHGEAGVPLLVVLRDVLGYADSRKEARYALDQDNVVINGTAVSDEERPVGMFDILAFDEREEYYRVFPGEGGRLALTPIDADAAGSKLGKIVGKRHVPGGDVQLTLHDGQTLLVEDDYEPGDSLVVA